MLLQKWFEADIIRDQKLCAIIAHSLANAKATKSTQYVDDEPVVLMPFQVVFPYEEVERNFFMMREEFLQKIEKLSTKTKTKVDFKPTYLTVKYLEMDTNITSIHFTPEILEGHMLSLSEWLDMDIRTFLSEHSDSYLENTKMIMNKFIKFTDDKVLSSITRKDYELFVKEMKQSGKISNTSMNDYTRALKASLRRALKAGYINSDPFKGMKQVREETKDVIFWRNEELYCFFNSIHCCQWIKDLAKLSLMTGMRRGEAANLLWENVDLEEMSIAITNSEVHKTKFNKTRILPINNEMVQILEEIRERNKLNGIESKFVITDEKGNNVDGDRIQKKVSKIVQNEQMRKGLSFHSFRKTFATKMRNNGAPNYVVGNFLGHTDIRTTNKYLGVPDEKMISAMQDIRFEDFLS